MKNFTLKRIMRSTAFFLSIVMVISMIIPILNVTAAEKDIALGKKAIACHQESDLSPDNALDGDSSSRFAAGGCSHNTWYVLDLQNNYKLSKVRINWQDAHPSSYILELSDDGQIYRELKAVNNDKSGWVETDVNGAGRFLRIREVTRALAPYGFSMYDLEVYGIRANPNNSATYYYVNYKDVKYGSLNLSHEGFVKSGTDVILTVNPPKGGSLVKLIQNKKDITNKMKDNKYTFTVKENSSFTAEFEAGISDKFECEDAYVLGPDGVSPFDIARLADPDASGGKVAGGTGGKYFIFEKVAEGNCIHIAYATVNTDNMNLYIRYPWEETFHAAGLIPFSTSNSWNMSSSYIAVSPMVYIPEGSDIKIRPNADCNMDRLWITSEVAGTAENAPANTITATQLSDNAEDDVMASYAQSVKLEKGQSVKFKVPSVKQLYNVLSLSYRAESTVAIDLKRGSAILGSITLDKTQLRTFEGAGMRSQPYSSGEELTLTVTDGTLWLDYVAVNHAPNPEVITIDEMPTKGERLTVSLDGTWGIGTSFIAENWSVPDKVPAEVSFVNSIPVPGLWHSAAYNLGEYGGVMSWYRKTVVIEEVPYGQALLYIGSAQYGRHIYVNGRYVGSYEYNYSHSYTDITDYLIKGENEIIIMLGAFSCQFNNAETPAHVLYDGESTEDEPGITDSVSLIFNSEPEVASVQVNPNIDKGTLQVQVTLQNRSETSVTSDVIFAVYELGVFENGVPNQAEKKVAEYIHKSVKINQNESNTFIVDDIKLDDWNKKKCWSPDSPFLYRVEIKTSGDTHSIRFGMRSFDFDPVTHYARLNGEIFYLFGTNVAIERYYDDPLCGTTPWEEEWIRKLYTEFKDVNWVCFRTHLGHANSKWYDIADEMGMMIFDEYPIWGNVGDDTISTIMPEIYAWIDNRGYHPSLIVFDAQNEATYDLTDQIIKNGRDYDLQKRPWDNGWRPPVGENDPVECHPYIIGTKGISGLNNMEVSKPIITTANIGWSYDTHPNYPYLINEHGEYWINREGVAMSGTAATWNSALPDATNEERLAYYAELMAAQMEAFRTERAYIGLLFFCGLGSSFPSAQGVTSDILSPDVSSSESLQIRPYIKKLLKNAFSDLGIVIDEYTDIVKRGDNIELPIVLINDTGKAVKDLPVTIKIMNGDTVLYAERFTMSVDAFSKDKNGLSRKNLSIRVPSFRDWCKDGSILTVTASYELNGEEVYSQRKWNIKDGESTDEELPIYDWLVETESSEDDTEIQNSSEETSDELPSGEINSEVTSDQNDATPSKGWFIPLVIGVILATFAIAVGGIAMFKKNKRGK